MAAAGVIGLIWWMLHFFSFPFGVVSITVLSFIMPETLWSKMYLGSNVPLQWSFTKTNWPTFKLLALVIVLSFIGSTLLFSSSCAWGFPIYFSSCTARLNTDVPAVVLDVAESSFEYVPSMQSIYILMNVFPYANPPEVSEHHVSSVADSMIIFSIVEL